MLGNSPKEENRWEAGEAIKGRLLGYMGRIGYRVWIPESKKIEESHNVTFEEGPAHRTCSTTELEEENDEGITEEFPRTIFPESSKQHEELPNTTKDTGNNQLRWGTPEPIQTPELNQKEVPNIPVVQNPPIPMRHSTRGHIPSRRYLESAEYGDREQTVHDRGEEWSTDTPVTENPLALIAQNPYAFAATSGELWVPQSYKQAMKQAELWQAPMEKEYKMLVDKGCWELVTLPVEANLTGGRWTYAIKFNANGKLLKRKAQYVVQGYTEIQGQDYDKTYGGVAHMESVHLVLAITAALRLCDITSQLYCSIPQQSNNA